MLFCPFRAAKSEDAVIHCIEAEEVSEPNQFLNAFQSWAGSVNCLPLTDNPAGASQKFDLE